MSQGKPTSINHVTHETVSKQKEVVIEYKAQAKDVGGNISDIDDNIGDIDDQIKQLESK